MATINSINSNIPIEISKGGTNATSFATTDGVVYYDGTRLVATTAGTTGQILSGVVPAYQTYKPGMVLLSSQTASNVAQIDFTSVITSTYSSYMLTFYDVNTTSGSASVLGMKVSTDNGANFLGGTNYSSGNTYNPIFANNAWTSNAVGGGGQWNMFNARTNSAVLKVRCNGTLYLTNLASTGKIPMAFGSETQTDSNGNFNWYNFCAFYNSTINVNAIRIFYASGGGNIGTGTFTLYGMVES